MLRFFAKYRRFGMVMLFLSTVILILFYRALKPQERLRVYQPADVNPELVDDSMRYVRRDHTVADFQLVNQNGDTVTQADYQGKIYVADFFFTTCPDICPIMTKNMAVVQEAIREDPEVFLLSHSVTPVRDSVPQLRRYADMMGVEDAKWNLVTGDKPQIYSLARKSYMAVKTEGDGGPYDMIHTENFMLVDKERRIRGYYDGTDRDAMDQLLADIRILKREYADRGR